MSAPGIASAAPGAGRRTAALLIALAVSAGGLAYAFHGIEWTDFARALRGARWGPVFLGAALAVSTFAIRAWRWTLLFGRLRPRFVDCLVATLLGFFFIGVLPLRVGEVIRPWVLARRSGLPFARTLATVATERAFDAATVLLLFFGSLLLLPPGVPVAEILAWSPGGVPVAGAAVAVLAAFVIALLLVVFAEGRTTAAIRVLLRPAPAWRDRLAEAIGHFAGGVRSCAESRSGLAAVVAGSFALWLSMAASFLVALHGFSDAAGPVGPRVGLGGGVFLQTVVALAVAAPAAPGFVGTFQFGCVFALGLLGVEKGAAAAFSVAFHVAHYAPTLAIGAALLPASGLRLRDARTPTDLSP